VVSATDPPGRILGFISASRNILFVTASIQALRTVRNLVQEVGGIYHAKKWLDPEAYSKSRPLLPGST
jgi:hypothetical protein